MGRKINEAGLQIIKNFEGCRLKTYKDQKGVLTIGYGHTGPDVTEDMTISLDQAEDLLKKDLENTESGVEKYASVTIDDNQFSALVSFAYNLGLGALQHSTLLKYVNEGKMLQAANEFLKWDHIEKVYDYGLFRRRKAERELFMEA